MTIKRICITGGNGLLGTKLLQAARESFHCVSIDVQPFPIFSSDRVVYMQGDVTDPQATAEQIKAADPDWVIHAAALTDVDACEREKEKAWTMNVQGCENVVRVCSDQHLPLVFVSTDYVFDGNSGPYGEEDPVHPLNHYGLTKSEGEKIVRAGLEDFIIVRTMVLYGWARRVRNNYALWLIDTLGRGETVRIVVDQFGTPTLADDLAEALLLGVNRNLRGLYHMAGSEFLSRHAFATLVAEVFSFDPSLIFETTSDRLKQPARRPRMSGLKTDRMTRETGYRFSSVRDGLAVIRRQMEENHIRFQNGFRDEEYKSRE